MIDIKYYTQHFFENDDPAPLSLKNGSGIFVYPVLVKDYVNYEICKEDVFMIDKNSISNVDIIRMSYLDYICDYIAKDEKIGKDFLIKLGILLKLVLHENEISIDKNNKNKNLIIISTKNKDGEDVVKAIIDSKEFDDLRKIVLYQNDVKYDDRYISPDVRKAINDYYKIKYNNCAAPSLERRKTYVISKTGILMKDINEMSYRTFDNVYKNLVDNDIYFANKILQGSEKYDIKENIKHPLLEKEVSDYDVVFSDAETFERKVQNGASGAPVS